MIADAVRLIIFAVFAVLALWAFTALEGALGWVAFFLCFGLGGLAARWVFTRMSAKDKDAGR